MRAAEVGCGRTVRVAQGGRAADGEAGKERDGRRRERQDRDETPRRHGSPVTGGFRSAPVTGRFNSHGRRVRGGALCALRRAEIGSN